MGGVRQKLKSPLPIQALQRTQHKTKSTKVTIVRFFFTSNKSVSQLPTYTQVSTSTTVCLHYLHKVQQETKDGHFWFWVCMCCQILAAYCNYECWQSAFKTIDVTCDFDRRAQMKAHGTLRLHSHVHWQVLLLAHMYKCSRC